MRTSKLSNYLTGLVCLLACTASTLSASAQSGTGDSLRYYIKIALENNPGLKAEKFAHQAFIEKIPQAGAHADPELSVEAYTMPMEVIGGRSIGNFSLMQMFPWFGTRKAARKQATHLARAREQQYREAVNQLILQVSTQWYTLQKLKELLENNRENLMFSEQLEKLAVGRYSAAGAGGGGMSGALRVQLEIAEIENNIESLNAEIQAGKARFNALLNREAGAPVMLGNGMQKRHFSYNTTDALERIAGNNPSLEMIQEEALAYQAKAETDRKMSYPMIGLGVEYMVLGKTTHPMFAMGDMNGKDMIMPMASLSLPIFRKKYTARQNESALWRKSSEANYKDTYNALKSAYYDFKNKLEDAGRSLQLYESQSKLARTTYKLILKEFVAGKSDLTNVIQVQRQLLEYQIKRSGALAEYNIMVVSMEKLLAENL